LKKPERFGPWIVTICRNVAKDMMQQFQKQRESAKAKVVQEPDCEEDERKAVLDQALQQLPQHLREVLFLRFYNEMSYEQMSSVLGATEQMIDGRIRRAKKKIAVYLKRKGFERW